MRRTSIVLAVATLAAAAVVPPAGAGTSAPSLQRGLRYESSPDDEQRVGFWVVGEDGDGATALAFHVDVRCGKGKERLFGVGSFLAYVDDQGRVTARGSAGSSEPEDGPETSGAVTVDGRVEDDGSVRGTVSFQFVQHNEQDASDVYARCEAENKEWRVGAGVADPSIARVVGFTPLSKRLRTFAAPDEMVADEQSIYVTYAKRGNRRELVALDPTTGEPRWTTELEQSAFPQLVVGAGVVWVGDSVPRDEDEIHGFSTADGEEVATVAGSAVAVGPGGEVWVAVEEAREVRRIDPTNGDVVATVPLPGEVFRTLAVGPFGLYVGVRPDAPIGTNPQPRLTRLDPASGAVLAIQDSSLPETVLPDATSLWIHNVGGVERLDPSTLAMLMAAEGHALPSALASSRIWLGGFDALEAIGASGTTEVSIPYVYGGVTATGSTVWLLEPTLGLIRVDAS